MIECRRHNIKGGKKLKEKISPGQLLLRGHGWRVVVVVVVIVIFCSIHDCV